MAQELHIWIENGTTDADDEFADLHWLGDHIEGIKPTSGGKFAWRVEEVSDGIAHFRAIEDEDGDLGVIVSGEPIYSEGEASLSAAEAAQSDGTWTVQ